MSEMLALAWDERGITSPGNRTSLKPVSPALNGGGEMSVLTPAMGVAENQRAELLLTEVSHQLTTGGGKPGQGYPAVLTSSAAASPARTYQWPVNVVALTPHEADCGLSSIASCPSCGQPFALSRTFQGFSAPIADVISGSSSGAWMNSGMLSAGQYSTASTLESRSAAAASTLSAVLQEKVSSKYFLSVKAAIGILRRAERRGKTLPAPLQAALTALAGAPKMTPT